MALTSFLDDLARRIYSFPEGADISLRVNTLVQDRTNALSSLIDIGNQAVVSDEGLFSLRQASERQLYCRAFSRPSPSLTLKANGELATCRITNAGEGYGNIHRQDIHSILNHIQDSVIFRLHSERRLVEYRKHVDTTIFGGYFNHLCTLPAILTLLARRMIEERIDPEDRIAVKRINLEVAHYTGHLAFQRHSSH